MNILNYKSVCWIVCFVIKGRTSIPVFVALFLTFQTFSQGIIINHAGTKINQIPVTAVTTAKQKLHIAYGHTSHGSQITDGMTGLVSFMNGKGYPNNLYAWNNGGTGGALDLHDYAMGGDVGYYPDWVNNTRNYLGKPDPSTGRGTGTNAVVNVIIWSWCGQVGDKYSAGKLAGEYIEPMVQLEKDYPGIRFVYMTGHLDHSNDVVNKAANLAVRDFCLKNNKILYDFADIESYDPDNSYFEFANDDCSYYSSGGKLLGNWASEWQNSHTSNTDWYNCGSAHSQPLNANQKAYAAWWLWARLAGWNPAITNKTEIGNISGVISVFPNPSDGSFTLKAGQNQINSIKLYNIMGTKVLELPDIKLSPESKIDIYDLKEGVYIFKIDCGGRIFSEKILVK
jgi:hypothetical protein